MVSGFFIYFFINFFDSCREVGSIFLSWDFHQHKCFTTNYHLFMWEWDSCIFWEQKGCICWFMLLNIVALLTWTCNVHKSLGG